MSSGDGALGVLIATESSDAQRHRDALASLPNALRERDDRPDIVLLSGLDGDAARVETALRLGARAVVVSTPGLLSVAALDVLTAAADDVTVVPALRYAPCVAAVEPPTAPPALVESLITIETSDLDGATEALAEQFAVIRTVVAAVVDAGAVDHGDRRYAVECRLDGAPNTVALAVGRQLTPSRLTLDVVAHDSRLDIEIDGGHTARPARIVTSSHRGSHTRWPVHQRPDRITWSNLVDRLLGDRGELGASVVAWATYRRDVDLARTVLADGRR